MPEKPTLAVIIPTYGAFDYAARAAHSALTNTQSAQAVVIVVDDATPGLQLDEETGYPPPLAAVRRLHPGRLVFGWFQTRGGLLRSWNAGLATAEAARSDYAVVTNSDVVFAPGWDTPLLDALADGYDLVGPVTNAPGTERSQYVGLYLPPRPGLAPRRDDDAAIARIAEALRSRREPGSRLGNVIPGPINGFCMMARTGTWRRHAHDRERDQVFRPRNDFDSKGRPNPTPTMTLGEYELQRRWHAAGLRAGICTTSYVFHYRSVSRGDRYRMGDWARMRPYEKPDSVSYEEWFRHQQLGTFPPPEPEPAPEGEPAPSSDERLRRLEREYAAISPQEWLREYRAERPEPEAGRPKETEPGPHAGGRAMTPAPGAGKPGRVSTTFTVWCADCPRSQASAGHVGRTTAERGWMGFGWCYFGGAGWLCPECAARRQAGTVSGGSDS